MVIKLPTIQREIVDGHVQAKRSEIEVQIDTSFRAHLKWEKYFASTVGCDLGTYVERVRNWLANKEQAKAQFIGLLKLLYCYINSERLSTFEDFCGLFDYEIVGELCNRIGIVLEEIGRSVSKN